MAWNENLWLELVEEFQSHERLQHIKHDAASEANRQWHLEQKRLRDRIHDAKPNRKRQHLENVRRSRGGLKPKQHTKCVVCNEALHKQHPATKYCSNKCRDKDHWKRRRERQKQGWQHGNEEGGKAEVRAEERARDDEG